MKIEKHPQTGFAHVRISDNALHRAFEFWGRGTLALHPCNLCAYYTLNGTPGGDCLNERAYCARATCVNADARPFGAEEP